MTTDVQLPFSRHEYTQRLDAVRHEMRYRDVDVVVVDETEHLSYLTGFGPGATMYQACIVPLNADPIMVLRALDEPSFTERSWVGDCVTFADVEDPVTVLAKTLHENGLGSMRIGLELDSHYLSVQCYQTLDASLPNATIVDFSGVLWELRLIKSQAEINYLQQASAIADEAMRRAIADVGPGVSERKAAITASQTFLELGADGGHIGRIASGGRSNSLHGALQHHLLDEGDIIHMELCPQVNGYSARLMRPTNIGEPSRERMAIAQALIEIQNEQIAAMQPGALAYEVDRVCRSQVLKRGLRESYDNATGYTLGYYGTPYPPRTSDLTRTFLPTSAWELTSGMVFHMYTSAHGMAFSETVLIGDTGPERLTRLERQLFHR